MTIRVRNYETTHKMFGNVYEWRFETDEGLMLAQSREFYTSKEEAENDALICACESGYDKPRWIWETK